MSRMKHTPMVTVVLEWLKAGNEITQKDAAGRWQEYNLRNKISVLRSRGWEILSREEPSPRGGTYKVYYMSERQLMSNTAVGA